MTDANDARAALAGIHASEARLAEHLKWPIWRHAAVGVLMGVLLLGQTIGNGGSTVVSVFVVIMALLIKRGDKKRDGVWVSGLHRGRTVWIGALLLLLALAAVIYVRAGIGKPQFEQPVFWLVLVATVVGSSALSLVWQRVFRAELRGTGK